MLLNLQFKNIYLVYNLIIKIWVCMSSHKLEVFTDYVCPWCYLGDSRVKKLKKIFNIDIQIIHFPLHPDTPKEGKSLLDLFGTNQEDIDKKIKI